MKLNGYIPDAGEIGDIEVDFSRRAIEDPTAEFGLINGLEIFFRDFPYSGDIYYHPEKGYVRLKVAFGESTGAGGLRVPSFKEAGDFVVHYFNTLLG